jgi:hypothetical protein
MVVVTAAAAADNVRHIAFVDGLKVKAAARHK